MLLAGRCNYLVVQTKDHFYLQYHFANSLLTWGENRTIINFIREVKLLRNIKGNIENVMTDIAIKSFISTWEDTCKLNIFYLQRARATAYYVIHNSVKAVIRIWNTNVRVYFIPYFYLKARLKSMFNILIHTTKRTQYVGLSIWKTDDRNVTIERQNFWMFSEGFNKFKKNISFKPLEMQSLKITDVFRPEAFSLYQNDLFSQKDTPSSRGNICHF